VSDTPYRSSPTKRRRRTRADVNRIKAAIVAALEVDQPMTLRQLFYRLVSQGAIDKTEGEYKGTVGRLSGEMRRAGEIPYGWMTDETRWMRKPTTHSSLAAALVNTTLTYRRAVWDAQGLNVEVWLEKEALAGVLVTVTEEWDVPLMVTKGYPSISFLFGAAESIKERGRPTFLYYFGDHDPSGVDIPRAVEKGIRELAPDAEITFERVAVNPWQIDAFNLPTRPTKTTDTRGKGFVGESVEVDAFSPRLLRAMAEKCITHHIDFEEHNRLMAVESAERETLTRMVEGLIT
jgi:hypothetical protein